MFRIEREAIDPQALAAAVRSDERGAVVTFAGVARNRADDGRPVTGLSYETYESMAVAEMEAIAREARERFGDCAIAMAHRVGELRVGEIAVVVAVASAHRKRAFEACEYAIDELKARAPIWKKEHYADGGAEWKANAGRSEARTF